MVAGDIFVSNVQITTNLTQAVTTPIVIMGGGAFDTTLFDNVKSFATPVGGHDKVSTTTITVVGREQV